MPTENKNAKIEIIKDKEELSTREAAHILRVTR